MNAHTPPPASPWLRPLLRAVITVVGLLVVIAILGFFVVPRVVKAKIEAYATEATGRKATLGKVEFNPFTLRGTLTDFTLAHRASEQSFFHFDALDVEVSPATIWRRAPVLNAIRLTRPTIALGRNADGTYDIQDLIDAWAKPSSDPTPLFSLNNIEIDGGAITLDDRMRKNKVALANLAIGIPFLSSLPHDAAIRVNPRLEGVLEGAHFMLKGTTSTPFADRKEATLDVDFDALALMEIAQYVPLPHALKLKDGALTTRLKLAFVSEQGEPRSVTLSGVARVDRLAVARSDDSLLAGARAIVATLGKLDPLGRVLVLDGLTVEAPELDVKRGSDGIVELQRLFAPASPPARPASAPAASPPASAWTYTVTELHVTDGKVRVADEGVAPAFRVALGKVSVEGKKIASSGDPGTLEVAFDSEAGAHFGGTADLDIGRSAARGHLSLTKFRLAELYPYYAEALNLDVRRGELDLAADFETAWAGDSPQLTLAQGSATLADVELAVRGERDSLWRVPKSELAGIAFDLAKRAISVERLEARPVSLRLIRHPNGDINFEHLSRTSAPATAGKVPADGDGEWNVAVRKLVFERLAADFEDQVPQPPVKLSVSDARVTAENIGNARNAKGTIDFTARLGTGGRVRGTGAMATRPFAVDWKIDVAQVDVLPLRPYFEAQTNVIVTSGAVSANGRLTYGAAAKAGPVATFAGDTTISDFGALDRPTAQELVRWKSLKLTAVDVADAPRKVALGSIALDEFYARIIVNADATLNLQRVLAPGSPEAAPTVTTAPAPKPAVIGTSTAAAKPAPPAPPPPSDAAAISIGDIKVTRGDVQFSDFYIKPNYSAHLTDVSGSVSALSATQAGIVEIAARVGNLAPVEVRGTVNPFAPALTLDLTAKATGVDLPPLSTYSGKYAGYGITKGALSFDVHYKIDNRKLVASNKLVLDQLTFGERVESPTATKLPILLAVALLKDGNGAIRLDLPVQGSLDDPEFSVFGIIVQIIVNLITKAITAPFALIGAIAGSHGEELAFVEFPPGRADLSPPTESKLQTLAKGLADRPALKLDIAGRAVPDVDREGLKRVALDRAIRAQKQKALVAKGDAAASLEALTIDPAERAELLAAVYRNTDLKDKPRNVIGFAKDIPPAEMESLLLASYGVDDEALRALANQRSETVKEWFTGKGGIASDRMFIVAPKLNADGIQDKVTATRVDFAIR